MGSVAIVKFLKHSATSQPSSQDDNHNRQAFFHLQNKNLFYLYNKNAESLKCIHNMTENKNEDLKQSFCKDKNNIIS